jgi:hypothetical protein
MHTGEGVLCLCVFRSPHSFHIQIYPHLYKISFGFSAHKISLLITNSLVISCQFAQLLKAFDNLNYKEEAIILTFLSTLVRFSIHPFHKKFLLFYFFEINKSHKSIKSPY